MGSTARQLLVSVPTLADPNFFRSVVFVIEHTDEGAVGLVLNQPTDALLTDALPDWADVAAPPAVAFVGGPVQQHDAVIGLARVGRVEDSDAWQPLLGRVGTVDLARTPADVRGDLEAVRVFAGYSGWGPGQLDDELEREGWFVVDALPGDLLTPDPPRCGDRCCAARAATSRCRRTTRAIGTDRQLTGRRSTSGRVASSDAAGRHRGTHPHGHRAPRRRRLRERGQSVARWTDAGIEVAYCICTNGEAGGFDASVPRSTMAEIRQTEQRAAAKVVGVTDVTFLGYPDGRLESTIELRRDISRVHPSVAAAAGRRPVAGAQLPARSTPATPTTWRRARRRWRRCTPTPATSSRTPSCSPRGTSRGR